MRAELIAVGSELLAFGRRDGNGDWIAERLQRAGIEVVARCLVGDDEERIASSVATALGRAEIVLLTGGLGPTEDDRTREGLARGLGIELERDPERLQLLRQLFEERQRPFRPLQERQADRPRGAAWLENPLGTAPGLALELRGRRLFALPGVPAEMRAMFVRDVLPRLDDGAVRRLARRTLKIAGRTESSVDEQLADLYSRPGCSATILAGSEGIELHLVCAEQSGEPARDRLGRLEQEILRRLGPDFYGRDDDDLPAVVGELLLGLGRSVATAESCTAGMLGAALTRVPGSSAWYRGGFVVYNDELKVRLAGVNPATLERHGAVSEAVARELARGARLRCAADFGIGVTGVAGPGGGSPEKPVGLVHTALDHAAGTKHRRALQFGDRELVRRRSVTAALDQLRRALIAEGGGSGPQVALH